MKILKNGRLSFKEKLISVAIKKTPHKIKKWAINKKIKEFGEMTELRFDPKKRELYAKVLLAGEKEPFELAVHNYEITKSGTPGIMVNKATTNRKWVSVLVDNYVVGKKFPLPEDKVDLIREILEEKS